MDWVTGIQRAIDYIEDNILEELDYAEIAKQAYVSSFHFQRIFHILSGFTLAEYIRYRRLSLAAVELANNCRVIDAAIKYGYNTPESFSRAFERFHGVLPSAANKDAVIKSFSRLSIKVSLEGGSIQDYRINEQGGILMSFKVTKVYKEQFPALRFIGKRYTNDDRVDGGFGQQWGEWFGNDMFAKMQEGVLSEPYDNSYIGLMTMRGDMSEFAYWIGMFFLSDVNVPEGFEFIDLPESDIGVGWVCGNEDTGEIYGGPPHAAVCKRLEEEGMGDMRNDIAGDGSDTYCFFERYNCPRFTEKDANSNVTLDYGNYLK